MKIESRPINNGETFCCSIKAAKEIFNNTSVTLSFAFVGPHVSFIGHGPFNPWCRKNVKGNVVAIMNTYPNVSNCTLFFFVEKEAKMTSELKKQFEQEFLPKFFNNYIHDATQSHEYDSFTRVMMVDFRENHFVWLEKTFK